MSVKRWPEDIAFSRAVRESYNYICLKCGMDYKHDTGYTDCAHVNTRNHRSTRWNSNYGAVCLCKSCHRRFTAFPLEWGDFLRREFGDSWYNEAKRLSWETRKYTKAEKKEIGAHYRAEEKRIKNERNNGQTGQIKLISYD